MKPVLLGMNQPVPDAEPLDPRIPRSSGYNLWRMLCAFTPCTADEFREAFDRRNVMPEGDWSLKAARAERKRLLAELQGRCVVLLGNAPLVVLDLPYGSGWLRCGGNDMVYTCIPHPSGLNRLYNDPAIRKYVGRLLSELYLSTRPKEVSQHGSLRQHSGHERLRQDDAGTGVR